MTAAKVLVVTGSMVSPGDRSLVGAARRQLASFRASEGGWLDLRLKAQGLELLVANRLHRASPAFRRAPYRAAVERALAGPSLLDVPELTEVVLAGLLRAEGLDCAVTTWAELYADPTRRRELLDSCQTVFASSTLLRDLSELEPLVAMVSRPTNHVVVGGALAGILHRDWPGCPGVDVLAVGYGERLVPPLAAWIRSGHRDLSPPDGGRRVERSGTTLLFSGLPEGKSLDDLPTPDWRLAGSLHGRTFPLVHYESVRGCPYRCSFCNYPYLFDDSVFRLKSAERIAADWLAYADQGVRWINCLDSLFTVPPQRLRDLCRRLIEACAPMRWACYARADDLADLATCELMHAAGCRLVHVGVESGDPALLETMNKRCTVESNAQALRTCREVGITSLATLFVGFPGETGASVRRTLDLLRSAPPDFYYAGPFTTRVEYLPILSPESRRRHGLRTVRGGRAGAPYWVHDTMSCTEVAGWIEWLDRHLTQERVALHAALFWPALLRHRPEDQADLLDFQRDALHGRPWLRKALSPLHRWLQGRLERDVERRLPRPAPR